MFMTRPVTASDPCSRARTLKANAVAPAVILESYRPWIASSTLASLRTRCVCCVPSGGPRAIFDTPLTAAISGDRQFATFEVCHAHPAKLKSQPEPRSRPPGSLGRAKESLTCSALAFSTTAKKARSCQPGSLCRPRGGILFHGRHKGFTSQDRLCLPAICSWRQSSEYGGRSMSRTRGRRARNPADHPPPRPPVNRNRLP